MAQAQRSGAVVGGISQITPVPRTNPARLVAGAALGNMVSVNTMLTYTMGIFISIFHATYGWSRADISLSMTFFTVVAFLGSSLVGKVADRHGPRLLAVASMLAFGLGLIVVPVLIVSVQTLWLAYLVLAILGLGTSPVVLNQPLMSSFSRRRGLALALALTGSGIGGFVLPQLTAALIDQGNWRYGFAGLGIMVLVATPLVWILLKTAQTGRAPHEIPSDGFDHGPLFRDICSTPLFWMLSLVALFGGLGMSGPAAHLIPMLGDHGFNPQAAARLASIIGFASVAGRLLTGICLDRFDTPLAGVPFLGLGAAGILMLGLFSNETAPLGIALLGFVIGAEVAILAYYSSRYFQLRAHATIFGWAYGVVAFGSSLGPVLVGALRDHQGSYAIGFQLSAIALALAGLSCLLLGPYRYAADGRG